MKIDRTNGIKELNWLLEQGIITQEIYDKAMSATDEEIEYGILRTRMGKLIANNETQGLKEIQTRLEELSKIIRQQKKR